MRATFTQPFSAPASVAEITHTQAHTHTITAPLIDVTHEFARENERKWQNESVVALHASLYLALT